MGPYFPYSGIITIMARRSLKKTNFGKTRLKSRHCSQVLIVSSTRSCDYTEWGGLCGGLSVKVGKEFMILSLLSKIGMIEANIP